MATFPCGGTSCQRARASTPGMSHEAKAKAKDLKMCPQGPSRPRTCPRGLHHCQNYTTEHQTLNHQPRTPTKPFLNLASLLTLGWCPEDFVMTTLTVHELLHWQTSGQTKSQTDTAEKNITIATQRCVGSKNCSFGLKVDRLVWVLSSMVCWSLGWVTGVDPQAELWRPSSAGLES